MEDMMELNWNYILAGAIIIIGVSEYVKSFFDKKSEKIKKSIYKFIPLGISLIVGGILSILQGINVWEFIFYSLLSLGFSVAGYETIIKFVQSFSKKINSN
jgi:hypothetical protein